MQLNLPWIRSRKRLIVAVIADGILFAFLYYFLLLCKQDASGRLPKWSDVAVSVPQVWQGNARVT